MLLFALISATVVGLASASGAMQTCADQAGCIEFSFSKQKLGTDGLCAGNYACQFEVCLHMANTQAGCVKQDTISHGCMPSNNTCRTSTSAATNTLPSANQPNPAPSMGNWYCQTGVPGAWLEFMLKDGSGCTSGGAGNKTYDAASMGLYKGFPNITCSPTPFKGYSCTGNPAGEECVWRVQLPQCDDVDVPLGYSNECTRLAEYWEVGWLRVQSDPVPTCSVKEAMTILEGYRCYHPEGCESLVVCKDNIPAVLARQFIEMDC